mgnify:CR=1 FL=1
MSLASSSLCEDILTQIFFTHTQQSSTALFGVEGEEYWRKIHKENFWFGCALCEPPLVCVHPIVEMWGRMEMMEREEEDVEDEWRFAEWYFANSRPYTEMNDTGEAHGCMVDYTTPPLLSQFCGNCEEDYEKIYFNTGEDWRGLITHFTTLSGLKKWNCWERTIFNEYWVGA